MQRRSRVKSPTEFEAARLAMGMSWRQLGEHLGIPPSTLRLIAAGRLTVRSEGGPRGADIIALRLGVEAHELFDEEPEPVGALG